MLNREALQQRLLATFREEAAEHAQALEEELRLLSETKDAASAQKHIEPLFRVMHTLKGAARSVRFSEIEQICQTSEAMLHGITRGDDSLTDEHVAKLKKAVADISRLLKPAQPAQSQPAQSQPVQSQPVQSQPAQPEPAQPQTTPPPQRAPEQPAQPVQEAAQMPDVRQGAEPAPIPENAPEQEQTAPALPNAQQPAQPNFALRNSESVRVGIGQLDRLLRAAEELLLPSLIVGERAKAARQLTESVELLRRQIRGGQASQGMDGEKDGAQRAAMLNALKEIENRSRRLAQSLHEDHRGLSVAVGELFKETRQSRMLPASSIFTAFSGMVRDICQETGKQAKWKLRDNGIELDRKVIEVVKDPLIHIVRNAVDHGIETPEQREASGKPKRGRITGSIKSIEGGRVAIEISDDGRGMDLAALRNAALRARAVSQAQVQSLTEKDLIDIAFRSGVSTRSVITSISGLGLGLSIVREQIERMDGQVVVQSAEGKGTTIRLELPSSVASYRGLLVSSGDMRLLWPSETVERVIGLSESEAAAALRTGMHSYNGAALPFAHIAAMLDLPPEEAPEKKRVLPCVVANAGGRRGVIMVDSVNGETDILMKDLPLRSNACATSPSPA